MSADKFHGFKPVSDVKVKYNLGAGLDIPAGKFVIGKNGESILNGGAPAAIGIVGIGNNYKSTIAKYISGRIYRYTIDYDTSYGITYDTEINADPARDSYLIDRIEGLEDQYNPFNQDRWVLTDKTMHLGCEFFEIFKKNVAEKLKDAKKLTRTTPFMDKEGAYITELEPTPTLVDSLTEFSTADVAKISDANSLGDSGGNTIFMRQGLSKTRFVGEIGTYLARGNMPLVLTAHIGKRIAMDPNAPPQKDLQFLKNGDEIKGVTSKFFFLTHICFQCYNATPLVHKETKAPLYPQNSDDNEAGDTDLMVVTLSVLRNKFGPSGMTTRVVVSQEHGVQPSLTEFYLLKMSGFGFIGNDRNYQLAILPEVNLSRTTIRGKIDELPQLRRALNITSEINQMQIYWSDKEQMFCSMEELHKDLIDMGYDWPTLIDTRGDWRYDNDSPKHEKRFLSSMDLLRMRKGLYVPYWWPKDRPIDLTKAK